EQRAAVLVGKLHRSAALGEAGDAALALAGNPVAVGWVEVGELYLALPLGLDGADLRRRDCLEFGVGDLVELLAARDACLEHLGIVEFRVHRLARCAELNLSVHRHGHGGSSLSEAAMTT